MTKKEKKEYLEQLVANQGNQAEIDAFIDAVNADPLHNIPKVYISGVVISFSQLKINEDEVNSTVEFVGGHYTLTLSKTLDSSLIVYTANA